MYSSVTEGIYELSNRPYMFRQNGELNIGDKERRTVIKICIQHLLGYIRKDGSVTDRFSEDDRIEDSVYALAAFLLADDKRLSPLIADIMEYVKEKRISKSAEILYKNIHDIKGFLRKYGEEFFKNTPSLNELVKRQDVKSVCSPSCLDICREMQGKRTESGVEDWQTAQEAKPKLNSRGSEQARRDERKGPAYQENIIKEQNVKAEGIIPDSDTWGTKKRTKKPTCRECHMRMQA